MTREFVINLENRPGTLAEVTRALGGANINIVGFCLQTNDENGTFRFVTNDEPKTENWLKSKGHKYKANEIITTRVKNSPGELGLLCESLSKSGVNIEACYPLAGHGPSDTELAFCVDDAQSARKVLTH